MYSGFRSPTPTTVPQAAALAARPALRRRVAATLIALAAICVLIPLQRASAADITGKVTTTASVKSGTYGEWSSIRVDVTFKVTSANTGDTFTMPLDKMLDARRFVSMDLKYANGAVVAQVTIKKDASGEGPHAHFRFTPEQITGELAQAGFALQAQHDFLPRQMYLIYTVK